jgi:hypothetical protein
MGFDKNTIFKFCDNYCVVLALNENDLCNENVI